ncbi:GUN4 domain-containing protein [Nostoc sp. UCD121]|uniref:AAA-like domain-containing protein n=1 Tax=unclassified Nostoc TaxID=2593658 RepID=UPI0016285E00|nr:MULTISPECIES: AAA-like domain-containing protein [unclassified Nostoc]MBC1220745.1 GUN4 domain-containing protein [Nostoc sp. UCD120]MBC1280802.1 GUN4 domain-containing protein [Nostoc sp. UCD121]
MKESVNNGSYRYQVGGALGQDVPSYVTRAADIQLYEALQAQEFCYVLNCRQMGKSSLMVRALARLKSEGWAGIVLDFSAKDSQVEQAERWYNGIINQLNRHFSLLDNARTWLKERDFLSPVERLEEFIETVLLPGINQRIVIFIDEIDSTLNLPFTDDFFALIRACYNKRAENPDYKRLTFALLGVAAPAELISDKKRTPFNIGQAIDLLGFGLESAQPLVKGLAEKGDNPQAVLAEILKWTGGQPFLTQRLCQLVVDNTEFISAEKEAESIAKLAHNCLINNWESQDEQEHLKTIRNRLLSNEQKAAYLLELYRQIRQAGKLKFQNTSEERELQLSGLVVKRDDHLTVYNPIYEQVFNEQWIDTQLGKLRPYSENFRFWVVSGGADESRLLRGKALQEAEEWARDKNLSYQDKQFLAASKEKEIQEEIAAKEQEAAFERERKDREAAEGRNQLLSEANKKAQRRISVGVVVLVVAVLGAATVGGLAKRQVDAANKRVETANSQVDAANERVKAADAQITRANKNLEQAQTKLTETQKNEQKAKNNVAQVIKQEQQAREKVENANKTLDKARNREKEILAKLTTKENKLEHTENELKNTSTKNKATKAEIVNVRELVALAGQLRNQSSSDSDEALRLAAVSFNIDNHELKQALLLSAKSQAYQGLKDWSNAKDEIQKSQLYLSKADQKVISLTQRLQVQVLLHKIHGDLLAQNKQTQKTIESYSNAFKILKTHPSDTDFTKGNQLLTGENIESVYRSLRKLKPQDKEVETVLKKHLYAQLEYFLKAKNWEAADGKTYKLILNIAKIERGYLDYEQMNNFSCSDLQRIDQLWVSYSDNRFGFSVQKEIWISTGNRLGIKPDEWTSKDSANYLEFAKRVGWYNDRQPEGNSKDSWMSYEELINNIKENPSSNSIRGGLPSTFRLISKRVLAILAANGVSRNQAYMIIGPVEILNHFCVASANNYIQIVRNPHRFASS